MTNFDDLIKEIEGHKEKGFIVEAFHCGEAFRHYEVVEKADERWLFLYGDKNKAIALCESWFERPNKTDIQKMVQDQNRGKEYPNEGICHYWRFVETQDHKYDMLVIGCLAICDIMTCCELLEQ